VRQLPGQVQRLVSRYLRIVDTALPGLVGGLYVVGSTALGDFQPAVSDADFVAVTREPVTGPQCQALASVHAEVAAETGLPALEGPYVTLSDLAASPQEPPDGPFHHDGALTVGHEGRTPVEWLILARYGLTVRGPEPAAVPITVDPAELTAWTVRNLDRYWAPWADRSQDPETQTAQVMLTDWGVAWAVLGVSRLHYAVVTNDITSKTGAGRHALATFPDRWQGIITEALRCRPAPLRRPDSLDSAIARRAEATEFVTFAINATRDDAPPP
jgi:hypothetical protein